MKKKIDLTLEASPLDNAANDISDKEMALLSRKFKLFFIKRRGDLVRISKHETTDVMKCYKFRKPGHIIASCPLLKSEYKRKKATCATLNEMEESESEIDSSVEKAMLCFVAFKDNKHVDYESDVNDQNRSYDDLLCAFEELHEDIQKVCKKQQVENVVHSSPRKIKS